MSQRMPSLVGRAITTASGTTYTLAEIAGYGSQGVVYHESSGHMMVKLYHPSESDDINSTVLDRLRLIQSIELPANFVRIEDIVTSPFVGYVMRKVSDHQPLNAYLIPDRDVPFTDWYNRGRGLRGRLFLGYVIAKAFRELEINNLSYCDISGNNILVKVKRTASVRIIDVDNIYVAGKGSASVFGTPRYIAPEVLRHERNPDVLSDNYSLAVILFELLRVGHPYISDEVVGGTPEDEEAAYSGELDYVSEENSLNMLPANAVLTARLQDLFEQCFVGGKSDRLSRPSARDYEVALLDAGNKIIQCPKCGAWHYPRKSGRTYLGCPWCESPSSPRARLNFYECLSEGKDFGSSKILSKRLTNTYILREGKNRVQGLYAIGHTPLRGSEDLLENCYTIAKNSEGYWAYNEFSKEDVLVVKVNPYKSIRLGHREHAAMRSGDRIFFGKPCETLIDGVRYYLSVMAIFDEVS